MTDKYDPKDVAIVFNGIEITPVECNEMLYVNSVTGETFTEVAFKEYLKQQGVK